MAGAAEKLGGAQAPPVGMCLPRTPQPRSCGMLAMDSGDGAAGQRNVLICPSAAYGVPAGGTLPYAGRTGNRFEHQKEPVVLNWVASQILPRASCSMKGKRAICAVAPLRVMLEGSAPRVPSK